VSILDTTNTCPDCGVTPGTEHKTGCDVAQCLYTGGQRFPHELPEHIVARIFGIHGSAKVSGHDCGRDVWTGEFPGVADAARLGWYSYFRPEYGEGTGWQRCPPDDPSGTPDLNRLFAEAHWNPATCHWEHP
jgi:hypothetical protein